MLPTHASIHKQLFKIILLRSVRQGEVGGIVASQAPPGGTDLLPTSHLLSGSPCTVGDSVQTLPTEKEEAVKWQQLGRAVALLGAGGLVGLQEQGREGVDFISSPNLVG